jgi:Lar family restriction alleviation protein
VSALVFGTPEAAEHAAPYLEPCPFCGSGDVAVQRGLLPGDGAYFVKCDDCEARGPCWPTKSGAVREWNKRAVQA